MRHLLISVAYAVACLVFCILAVTVTKEKQSATDVEETVVTIKKKVYEDKDDASQSLTTQHPEPTNIAKSL